MPGEGCPVLSYNCVGSFSTLSESYSVGVIHVSPYLLGDRLGVVLGLYRINFVDGYFKNNCYPKYFLII